jgi:hypothetical protein
MGAGLIGGTIPFFGGGYAAAVSAEGVVSPFSLTVLAIESVSLNDSDIGLIAGEGGGSFPYAAYIIDGAPVEISLPFMSPGHLYGAAVNSLGNGIFGGNVGSTTGVAAFVTSGGGYTDITLSGANTIYSVAINDSGLGLLGGVDNSGNAYAVYVTPELVETTLFGSPFTGTINSVAMNSAGAGLIGGQNGSNPYAAFVQPNGSLQSLISDAVNGEIHSVAINEAGVGLIGGQQNSTEGYAALVAPNGTLTTLNVSSENTINGVALNDVTSAATPQSFGLYFSMIYTQLAANYTLESRFTQNQSQTREKDEFALNDLNLVSNEKNAPSLPKKKIKKNTFWAAPFGDYVHLKAQGSIPSYRNEIGGGLLGYDYQSSGYIVGASLGYAFNYIHYSEGLGHGKVQEEMACFYGGYSTDHFRINGILWGGIYQFWNVRHTLSILTSKALTHGWILSPHLEMASPWAIDQQKRYVAEPFFMLDWVNSWMDHFTETGDSGFNIKMGDVYGSLLQSEVGCRFYEKFIYGWGNFCMEEKVSYINQAPFNFNSATTAFVGSASSFPIAVASTKIENLAALQLAFSFLPKNNSYPFGGLTCQAMANSSYQSYFVSAFTGFNF